MRAIVRLRSLLAGKEALRRLKHSRFVCLAAFDRSFYLKNEEGKLVCLARDDLEPGPLNVLCAPWPDGSLLPSPGKTVIRRGDTLCWSGASLAVGNAQAWIVPVSGMDTGEKSLSDRLMPCSSFLAALSTELPDTDFAPLFAWFLGEPEPFSASSPFLTPLLAAGFEAVAHLMNWLSATQTASPPLSEVRGLLGLGPGLTPSGDDILGGTMVALCAIRKKEAAAVLYAAIKKLPQHTNTISLAHLELAAQGEGAEALHLFISSLLEGQFSINAARRLGAVGHSSGWDMALGAALALYASARTTAFQQVLDMTNCPTSLR